MSPRTFILDSIEKRDRVLTLLAKLPMDGRIWDLRVAEWQPNRTLDQNRRLWKLHTLAGQESGYAPAELHEIMLGEFFGWVQRKTPWGEFTVPRERSHDKNKKVFKTFMDFVEQRYIEEYGILLGDE